MAKLKTVKVVSLEATGGNWTLQNGTDSTGAVSVNFYKKSTAGTTFVDSLSLADFADFVDACDQLLAELRKP
jgi:hypothetical protein